jgi:hypothetical protein
VEGSEVGTEDFERCLLEGMAADIASTGQDVMDA